MQENITPMDTTAEAIDQDSLEKVLGALLQTVLAPKTHFLQIHKFLSEQQQALAYVTEILKKDERDVQIIATGGGAG
jgi:hypothetical protein